MRFVGTVFHLNSPATIKYFSTFFMNCESLVRKGMRYVCKNGAPTIVFSTSAIVKVVPDAAGCSRKRSRKKTFPFKGSY